MTPGPASDAADLLDERAALRAARFVTPTRIPDPEGSRRLRAQVKRDMPRIDAAARDWTGLGHDLGPTTCRVVSRPGWVRANLAGLRGALDPVADKLGKRPKLASKVMGAQLGALLGLLSTKVLGQFVIPLGNPGGGQLVVVGPNLLELADEHGGLATDIHRTVLLHEVTHRLQFDGVDWLGEHLRSLVASYLADTKVDPERLTRAASNLPQLLSQVRETGSITPFVEALMTEHQRDVLEQAQGLMSLLEGHGMAAMYAATDGVVDDPAGVREALSARAPDATAKILTAVAGLQKKKDQYTRGESFVDHVVEAAGTAGLNRAFASAENLPTVDEVADPDLWLVRVGLSAA